MKVVIAILIGACLSLVHSCTSIESVSLPEPSNELCESFWRDYASNMEYKPDLGSVFFVLNDWALLADSSRSYHSNIEKAFYENKSCLIGLPQDSVLKLLGSPTYSRPMGRGSFTYEDHIYMYYRRTGEPTGVIYSRQESIVVEGARDTIQEVAIWPGSVVYIR